METNTIPASSANSTMETTAIFALFNNVSTSNLNMWTAPVRIAVNVLSESIEMIYEQTSMVSLTIYPSPSPARRVFKIIYSCVDGKWNVSNPIYGKIISPRQESYEFEE